MVLSRLKPARRSSGALATSRRYSRWGCFVLGWWRLSGTRSFCHEVVAVKVQHRPAAAPPLYPQSRLQAGATLAPWFWCGWLVQRSLGLFGPARRCRPGPFSLAASAEALQSGAVVGRETTAPAVLKLVSRCSARSGTKLSCRYSRQTGFRHAEEISFADRAPAG